MEFRAIVDKTATIPDGTQLYGFPLTNQPIRKTTGEHSADAIIASDNGFIGVVDWADKEAPYRVVFVLRDDVTIEKTPPVVTPPNPPTLTEAYGVLIDDVIRRAIDYARDSETGGQ